MNIRTLYLVLAVIGAVVPYAFFLQHFQSAGLSLWSFLSALFANGAAGGFTADLLITSFVFWIAIIRQHRINRGPAPLAFIVINLLVGLSCALPAWLYWRESQTQEI